mgnify:CR=1 FL=1
MKVLYLHQYFNTPEMSGGTRSFEMARRWVAMGHEVAMVTSWREDGGRRGWFVTNESGIRVHWLQVPYSNEMGYRERIAAFLEFAIGAARKAASLPADVVFATSTPLTIAIPGVWAKRQRQVPMVFEVRDLWPELPIAVGALKNPLARAAARWLERFAYRNADHVVALSPGMRDGVTKTGFPDSEVTVIPNSADLELFHPSNADRDRFRQEHPEIGEGPLVVYTGTMGRINGVGYLARVAAAAYAQGSSANFVVVGSGREEAGIRNQAEELGVLGRNFHMFPPVPKQEMSDVLAAADLALSLFIDLEPMWANSANKFFDALASGTAVAINYGGWQAELLGETGAGIVLPPDDTGEAAARIEAFLAAPAAVRSAAKAARRLAEERFDRDKLSGDLETVLRRAVECAR